MVAVSSPLVCMARHQLIDARNAAPRSAQRDSRSLRVTKENIVRPVAKNIILPIMRTVVAPTRNNPTSTVNVFIHDKNDFPLLPTELIFSVDSGRKPRRGHG